MQVALLLAGCSSLDQLIYTVSEQLPALLHCERADLLLLDDTNGQVQWERSCCFVVEKLTALIPTTVLQYLPTYCSMELATYTSFLVCTESCTLLLLHSYLVTPRCLALHSSSLPSLLNQWLWV